MHQRGVKKYTANSMREALAMVRQDLGPDALIISQERAGNKTLIFAGLEQPASNGDSPENATPESSLPPSGESSSRDVGLEMDLITVREPKEVGPRESEEASADQLMGLEYPYQTKRLDQLEGKFRFIGASGVGKTSMLIKILVEWVMVNGPADALVVTTDNQQLAANESLHLTCELLGGEIVHDNHQTHSAATRGLPSNVRNKRLVLIDTASTELEDQAVILGVRDVLVVSVLHSSVSLGAQLKAIEPIEMNGFPPMIAVTHVDQVFDQQAFMGWLLGCSLPVAFVGSSAYLPGGIEVAAPQNVKQVFELTDA